MIASKFIGPELNSRIRLISKYSSVARVFRRRRSEFPSLMAMDLALVAMTPDYRTEVEDLIDQRLKPRKVAPSKVRPEVVGEVIIGGGVHAAIYAAGRVAAGKPMPLVIERDRIGGVFGVSRSPAFWLNSRNRPGDGGLPSENAALNVIPGAPVQLSHLSALEFQSNADLAFVTRVMLAQNAWVKQGVSVEVIQRKYDDNDCYTLLLSDGSEVQTERVIDARGLGDTVGFFSTLSPRMMNFVEFLRRLDMPFPLEGMKRVAVVGSGDSARTVVEALLGQGPSAHMSVAALDWVDQVDWYAPGVYDDCSAFRAAERGRYSRLGSFLQQPGNGARRLRVMPLNGTLSATFGNTVSVNGRSYDHVIGAMGWTTETLLDYDYFSGDRGYFPYGSEQAFGQKMDEAEVYSVGPRAQLGFDGFEATNATSRLPQNEVALFRLGWRTAALAARLS